MARYVRRKLEPDPDGALTVFAVPAPGYIAGTTTLWHNGIGRKGASSIGFTETDPDAGTITTKFVAATGDQLLLGCQVVW